MSEKIKILILAKTYPVLSEKYDEIVCTAGIREDGTWIRIYPIPFRFMEDETIFRKFQWIEAVVEKRDMTKDFRPESHHITDINTIKPLEFIKPENNWLTRKTLLKNTPVYTNINQIINLSKQPNNMSLAIFKPKEICNFIFAPVTTEEFERFEEKKKTILEEYNKQGDLFEEKKEFFTLAEKVPYVFKYEFIDDEDTPHTMMIEDWEIGMLYRNCLKQTQSAEKAANMVKQKYFDEFKKKDLLLFLGTTRLYHQMGSKNPFIIIGVFYPPKEPQVSFNFEAE